MEMFAGIMLGLAIGTLPITWALNVPSNRVLMLLSFGRQIAIDLFIKGGLVVKGSQGVLIANCTIIGTGNQAGIEVQS